LPPAIATAVKEADPILKPISPYYTFDKSLAKDGCKKLDFVIEPTSTSYDRTELLKHAFPGSITQTAKFVAFLNSPDPFAPAPPTSKNKNEIYTVFRATSSDVKKYAGARFCIAVPPDGGLPVGFYHIVRTNPAGTVRQIGNYSFGQIEEGYEFEGTELVRNADGNALNPDEPNMDLRVGVGDTFFLAYRQTNAIDGKVQYPREIQFVIGSYTKAVLPRESDDSAVVQMAQESVIVQVTGEYDPAKKDVKFSLAKIALGTAENLTSAMTEVVPHHAAQEKRGTAYLRTTGGNGLVEQGLLNNYGVAFSKLPSPLQEMAKKFKPFEGRTAPGENSDLYAKGFLRPVEVPLVFETSENGEFLAPSKKDLTKVGGADLSFKLEIGANGRFSIYGVRLSKSGKEPSKALITFSAEDLVAAANTETAKVLFSQVAALQLLKCGANEKDINAARDMAFVSLNAPGKK
jgi:hypothetical protein